MVMRRKEPVEGVRIDKSGRSVVIVYKSKMRWVERFDEYLRVFHDPKVARSEYLFKLWYVLSVFTDLDDSKVKEIVKTVKERLEKT
jgi:hypothetical protein